MIPQFVKLLKQNGELVAVNMMNGFATAAAKEQWSPSEEPLPVLLFRPHFFQNSKNRSG